MSDPSNMHSFMAGVGWKEMGIKGLGPEGLVDNPELVRELLLNEGIDPDDYKEEDD